MEKDVPCGDILWIKKEKRPNSQVVLEYRPPSERDSEGVVFIARLH